LTGAGMGLLTARSERMAGVGAGRLAPAAGDRPAGS
jgi:hypothetical protein